MSVETEPRVQPYAKCWATLAVILGAEAMDLLDASSVTVSAPTIGQNLNLGLSSVQWNAAAYTLAMAVGLITGGQLGNIVGCRRMFLAGVLGPVLAVEVLGSLFLARSFGAVMGATGKPVPMIVGIDFLLPRNAQ